MQKTFALILASTSILLATPLAAVAAEPVTPAEIAAHVRFLSSDLLEGRDVGSRGEELAVAYMSAVYEAAGLEPAFDGSYVQELALTRLEPDLDAQMLLVHGAERGQPLTFGHDFVARRPLPESPGIVEAELVFVGYGISSDRWQWDDYGNVDLEGKIAVILVNEPGRDQPDLFEGGALTYFGRWVYKFEEAARRGALGALLIHTPEDAGYGWTVIRTSWVVGESFCDPTAENVTPIQGWISEDTAVEMFRLAGLDFSGIRTQAELPTFTPIPLGVTVHLEVDNSMASVTTRNVAGIARGSAADGSTRTTVISAHYDHFGRAKEGEGDLIYNGALDNCSAVATLLALARRIGRDPDLLGHDVLFLACAAEERNLLGSAYFARHPPLPVDHMAANLNLEMTNVWGQTSDLMVIGGRYSDLGDLVAEVAAERGLSISPDAAPEQGFFFRSDQLSFARQGVPAAWIDGGTHLLGQPEGEMDRLREHYRATAYHRPSDEFDPTWELTGTVQVAEIVLAILRALDGHEAPLEWKPGAGF